MRHLWILLVVAVFGLVYWRSLTFLYVEGDDAASVAYHAMGRNASIQPPYNPWQSGMDRIMSFLPPDAKTVRTVGMALTAMSACLLVILILTLGFSQLDISQPARRLALAGILLLAAPEFFYLGMVYTPAVIGLTLALIAHLLARRAIVTSGGARPALLFGSVLLFGWGASIRWDQAIYGVFIFVDLLIGPQGERGKGLKPSDRIPFALLWSILAIPAWILWIYVSGYGLTDLTNIARHAAHTSGTQPFSVATIGSLQTLFTPAFVLLYLVGMAALSLRQRALAVTGLLAWAPVYPWLSNGAPKAFLMAIPAMAVCVLAGSSLLWSSKDRLRIPALVALAIILLIPWVIGGQVKYRDEVWGPGFEMQPYDRPIGKSVEANIALLGAGLACPTQEGPRPLFGHGAVLIGSEWRRMITTVEDERVEAVRVAMEKNLPIVVIKESDFHPAANLIELGYRPIDPARGEQRAGPLKWRRFRNAEGAEVRVARIEDLAAAFAGPDLSLLRETLGDRIVVYGYRPSRMREAYLAAPEAFEKVNSNTAIVHLDRVSPNAGSEGAPQ